jgi:UV DNA damage endonuclease
MRHSLPSPNHIRFGLCCQFRDQPIRFVNTTATSIARLERTQSLAKLSRLCLANAEALMAALRFCAASGIGCFRLNSQILPLKTHSQLGYTVDQLPAGAEIEARFRECGRLARESEIRTSFHPDQFVVLNSPRPEVVEASIRELDYQSEVAEWVGADVVNIHGGGAYGDKAGALANFARNLGRLSSRVRSRLTVENDDKLYAPADLLPLCLSEGVPLVYDVHHHRCHPDQLTILEATEQAVGTWNRQPLFHISSPLAGWTGPKPERHHDYVDVNDFPECWRDRSLTVEVEAKAKELAVLHLMNSVRKLAVR